jgi:hypothetical protein
MKLFVIFSGLRGEVLFVQYLPGQTEEYYAKPIINDGMDTTRTRNLSSKNRKY